MSDDKLLHALRNSKGWPILGNAAADRIEELEAENERLRAANEFLLKSRSGIFDRLNVALQGENK